MRDPIIDRLDALAADADRVVLADPADLRRTGDRRSRRHLVAATVAVFLVIGGVAVVFRPSSGLVPVPVPAQSALPSVSPAPAATPSSAPSGTPGTPRNEPCATDPKQCYPPAVRYSEEMLPAPCPTTTHPSDAKLVSRTSQRRSIQIDGPGTTMYGRTVSTYSAGGAAAYLTELRSALARCSSVQRPDEFGTQPLTLRYRLISNGEVGGDDSVLLSRTYRVRSETTQRDSTFRIAVVRVGDTVVVTYDVGWEGNPSSPADFDRFGALSVQE